jgi:hypothetical protein
VSTLIEVNFSPLSRRYTLEELWALPERDDHAHYNLIAGYLFIVPPPEPPHGDLVSLMNRSLVGFLIDNNIEGDVNHPPEPIYVRAEASTYLEPDIMYLSTELRQQETIEVRYASKVGEITVWKILKYSRGQHAASRMLEGYRVSVDDLFNEVKERFSHG